MPPTAMYPRRVERKLAAIFSADAAGYSRLMAADEIATAEALEASRTIMGERIRQHGGRVVDAVGDNLLAEFASVVDSVACAIQVQQEITEHVAGVEAQRRLLFRIGIHLGDVIVQGERLVGDGVNVAARIEATSEAGGLSLSGTAFDQVAGRLPLDFEDLGPTELKNIPRPVRIYRLKRTPEGEPAVPADAGAVPDATLTVPGFSGRAAIAVLAFDNRSGDPEQEYFADGIAEDLITRLSRWRIFPVIARNSSFVYKGRAVDVKQVSRDLGVGYVVEGSVRKGGKRVRINAQLSEATRGHQVWAESYNRELADIFDLQDEIAEMIVASLEPALARVEQERVKDREPRSLDTWDTVQRGWWHLWRFQAEEAREARSWAQRALEIDPRFAPATTLLAGAHLIDLLYGWGVSAETSLTSALADAENAVAQDSQLAGAHFVLGMARSFKGDSEAAIVAHERALDLNPSLAWAYWGLGIALGASQSHSEDGSGMVEKALRLSPHDPMRPFMLQNLGVARLMAERYDEAASCARKSLQIHSEQPHAWRLLAATCGHLGRIDEARSAFETALRLAPNSVEDLRLLNRPAIVERVLDGWRKAGWEG